MADNKQPEGKKERFTDGIQPQWAPRVPPGKIRRLYQNDALGLVDEELIEDVGTTLILRCQSMLTAIDATLGRATCPRCGALIPHTRNKAQHITCPECAWQTTVGEYLATIKDRGLVGGGSEEFARTYVETYPTLRTPRERMLLIDRLIHAFHWEMRGDMMSRPVGSDLIAGRFEEVVELLDTLTYGEKTTPEISQERRAWDSKVERSGEWYRRVLAQGRSRRDRTGD